MEEQKKPQVNKDCYKGIKFLPPVPTWLFTKYSLTLTEAVYYSFLLTFKCLTWDYEYTGKVLQITKRSVCNMISKFVSMGLIRQEKVKYGSRFRVIIVPLFDENGKIPQADINHFLATGKLALDKFYLKAKKAKH